jgi:hypothetical protein
MGRNFTLLKMKKINRKYFLILLILIFIGVIALFLFYFSEKKKFEGKVPGNETLFIVDYGNGKQRWFQGEVIEGMTFLQVLQASARAGNFDYEANSEIKSINGVSNNDKKQWKCYIDSFLMDRLIDDLNQPVFPQTKIFCKYK